MAHEKPVRCTSLLKKIVLTVCFVCCGVTWLYTIVWWRGDCASHNWSCGLCISWGRETFHLHPKRQALIITGNGPTCVSYSNGRNVQNAEGKNDALHTICTRVVRSMSSCHCIRAMIFFNPNVMTVFTLYESVWFISGKNLSSTSPVSTPQSRVHGMMYCFATATILILPMPLQWSRRTVIRLTCTSRATSSVARA